MAIVKKVAVAIYPAATFAPLKAVIDSLQLPFITSTEIASDDSKFTITFDTGAVWEYSRYYEDWNVFLGITRIVQGSSSYARGIHTMNTTGESATVTICASPEFLHIKVYTPWRTSYLVGFYHVLEDNQAITGVGCNVALSNMSLVSTQTLGVYSMPNLLNYAASMNHVQYMNHAPIMSGGVKYYDSWGIYACSTVTTDNVITFGGDNYYAVDSHLLIPMDPEQSNG